MNSVAKKKNNNYEFSNCEFSIGIWKPKIKKSNEKIEILTT